MGELLKYCPKCSKEVLKFNGIKKYNCNECGWEYYQNTAAAVAGIIEFNGKVLVVERNREPGKGMLDFPGGFVDPDESAEEALIREVKEELYLDLKDLKYLGSAPNDYEYKKIDYTTCDMFFLAKLDGDIIDFDQSEIANYHWVNKSELKAGDFAFKSMRKAIEIYKDS